MRAFAAAAASAALLLVSCAALTPADTSGRDATLRLYRPGAAKVQVVGDWNDWGGTLIPGGVLDPDAGLMERDGDGWWVASPRPGRGRHRYAFVIDGSVWIADPANPETARFGDRVVSVLVTDG
jgi:1,4-alpha-glucan branching enzyme